MMNKITISKYGPIIKKRTHLNLLLSLAYLKACLDIGLFVLLAIINSLLKKKPIITPYIKTKTLEVIERFSLSLIVNSPTNLYSI